METQLSAIVFDGVTKAFPGVIALDAVSFSVQKGEVHALLGENGAGKSTLLNILHGVYAVYEGHIHMNGETLHFRTPHDAIKKGVAKVHQEVNLVPEMTVAQNILLGYEPNRGFLIDHAELNRKAQELLDRLGSSIRADSKVVGLSAGEMQMIGIAKALLHKAEVISLDEPTASLSDKEVDALFSVIGELRAQGITILYVSHRLEEVFKIADRATILRDGRYIGTYQVKDLTRADMIKKMVGRDVSVFARRNRPRVYTDQVVLKAENFSRAGVFSDLSIELHKGEILGFAGLVGAKRTDFMRSLFGADPRTSGTLWIRGVEVSIHTPQDALAAGLGLIPEERKTQGVIRYMTNADNIGITCLKNFTHRGFLNHGQKRKNCEKYIAVMNLHPEDPDYVTDRLSGGNQQKVVVAKWLSTQADILILDEPTKGIDVGAKAEIYNLLEDMVADGKSIIIVSSEMSEIIGMCDRAYVMHEGGISAELTYSELTEETILHHAMGGSS
ncbi:MAG: sugar ABC transporter ATP-binding protein [Spirochaetota bacterium]